MATNQKREDGRHISVTPTNGAALSGAPGRVGEICGVAENDVGTDGKTVIDTGGVYALAVQGIDQSGNSAVAVGDILYYVDANTPKLSKVNTGHRFGYALGTVPSANASTVIDVKIGY
jgi:predicted RecA/RadA family phage recombinase